MSARGSGVLAILREHLLLNGAAAFVYDAAVAAPEVIVDGRRLSDLECAVVKMALDHFLTELQQTEIRESTQEMQAAEIRDALRELLRDLGKG